MRTSADHRGRQKTGEGLVARGTMGKPVTFFFTENGTDPNGIKLGKAKRGGCCKFRYLQFNNFAILTLLRA